MLRNRKRNTKLTSSNQQFYSTQKFYHVGSRWEYATLICIELPIQISGMDGNSIQISGMQPGGMGYFMRE